MNWKQVAGVIGTVAALLGIMDRFYYQRARGDVLEARFAVVEQQNKVYESILRHRFGLDYGPISPEGAH